MVAPGIAKRFRELGYHFDSVSPGGHRILDENGKVKTEVDILLENGEYIVAVEMKTKPVEKDIERHMRRLEILREHRNKHHDARKIQGAIAGAIFPQEVKKLSHEAGLYVLEQSGDTMKIDIPEGFTPREW
jgi:Holliday junction resolvase-like predicted endonuclease